MWTQLSFILSQIMCLTDRQTDRQTDERTALSWLDRVACNTCSAVKSNRNGWASENEIHVRWNSTRDVRYIVLLVNSTGLLADSLLAYYSQLW